MASIRWRRLWRATWWRATTATPADDVACVAFARAHGCAYVTNDGFATAMRRAEPDSGLRRWLESEQAALRIKYAFLDGEFVPYSRCVQPQKQSRFLGEALYPLVEALQQSLAPKITGMLLYLGAVDVVHLIENPDALRAKVAEAVEVLRRHARTLHAATGSPPPGAARR